MSHSFHLTHNKEILRYLSTVFKDKYPGILLSQTVTLCLLYFIIIFFNYHFMVENEGSSEQLFDVSFNEINFFWLAN